MTSPRTHFVWISNGLGLPSWRSDDRLHWACYNDNVPSARQILRTVPVDARNDYLSTPLHWACAQGNVAAMELLMENKAPLDAEDLCVSAPLHYACLYNRGEVVDVLLRRGARVDARNDDGCTPLHLACYSANEGIVQSLLLYGADIDARNDSGATPLHYALVEEGICEENTNPRLAIAELLLANGAKIVADTWRGFTVFDLVRGAPARAVIISALVDRAAAFRLPDDLVPIIMAFAIGNPKPDDASAVYGRLKKSPPKNHT